MIATVPVGRLPASLVASADGSLVYVTSEVSNSISAIDTGTNQVAFTIPISGEPFRLAISPDGTTLYCTLLGNNAILLISTTTKQISQTFATGFMPQSEAVSPNGKLVYVPDYDGTITVIRKGVLRQPINVGGNPVYVTFTPDGSYAYYSTKASHTASTLLMLPLILLSPQYLPECRTRWVEWPSNQKRNSKYGKELCLPLGGSAKARH